ncbi:MAG: hypothetical protein MUC63_11065 [Planctomycetes bacterium]|nr:hypothetical protein [Planctomycetota bacterium]
MLPEAGGGILTVRLETGDDLPADDEASVLLLPPRQPRLLLVTRGNVFLEQALRAVPGVAVETAAPGAEAGFPASRPFDAAVFDAVAPPVSAPARAFLCFGAAPPGREVRLEGEIESPLFGDGDWDDRHPVNRYVDYSGLFVGKALRARIPGNAAPLLESRAGPLAAAFDEGGPRAVAVFFDLRESDWPFQVSFPVFLTNAVQWLCAGEDSGAQGEWHRAGEPVPFRSLGAVRVRAPDGRTAEVSPDEAGTREESDTRPRAALELPGETVEAGPAVKAVNRERWPWLVLAAIALLVLEWWVYHRRAV